jgi:hypothetical protein
MAAGAATPRRMEVKLTKDGFLAHLKTKGMEQIELTQTKLFGDKEIVVRDRVGHRRTDLQEIQNWVSVFYTHEGRTPAGTEVDDLVRDLIQDLADRKIIRL